MIAAALAILLGLLALGIPVAAVLALLGYLLGEPMTGLPAHRALGELAWSANSETILVAVPMFILMGEIILRSGIAGRMYEATAHWLSWLPGGLMHANIGACALFAAASGSSAATAATISTISIPQMRRRGYDRRLFLGSLAAGGTLGILIPPSIDLIVYGVITQTSIPKLYLAGAVPGLLLALFFGLTIFAACPPAARPLWAQAGDGQARASGELARTGATASDLCAGNGVDLCGRRHADRVGLDRRRCGARSGRGGPSRRRSRCLPPRSGGTMRTTSMILLILTAAVFLSFAAAAAGLTERVSGLVTGLGLSPLETLAAVVALYLVLGCFMETMAMMITTLPVVAPTMFAAGFDPVWFGIVVILLVETAMITPPVGVNLYVVQGVRRSGPLLDVMIGALPFVGSLLAMIALLTVFPEVALWLPGVQG